MSLVLFLLAQVAPPLTPGAAPPLRHETTPLERPKPRRQAAPADIPVVRAAPGRLQACLDAVEANAQDAAETAQDWAEKAQGPERAQAGQCLGVALSRLGRWNEAEAAFLTARDAAPAGDSSWRARLGAMAGNAALARGAPDVALLALDRAHDNAVATGDKAFAGEIALDRGRALAALKRNAEAEASLAEARGANPQDPQAWLLSATLSRRMGKLADAQGQIEKAAQLLPVDPEIGLEAGVIAVLSGRNEAARKSWQSVIDAAPASEAAATARGYIAQLGTPPGVGKP